MKTNSNEIDRRRNAYAIGIWENEGGAPGRDSMDNQCGHRVELDRSWTIHHFSPVLRRGRMAAP
ncbi:hypothetical protein FHT86_004207 [Rhizobium sp. BK313]|uniref:hypothetical protein n=1 Tax=Rhizobium sp. BK313 TaxID=2587081 RepID=UPI0010EA6BC0|nr:hypothetical protein [Rhizobium sp. BK313]MBB3455899.1 hypothetical protein [Rhizobium sp. BK313]